MFYTVWCIYKNYAIHLPFMPHTLQHSNQLLYLTLNPHQISCHNSMTGTREYLHFTSAQKT